MAGSNILLADMDADPIPVGVRGRLTRCTLVGARDWIDGRASKGPDEHLDQENGLLTEKIIIQECCSTEYAQSDVRGDCDQETRLQLLLNDAVPSSTIIHHSVPRPEFQPCFAVSVE
jgi:hypothetical protein